MTRSQHSHLELPSKPDKVRRLREAFPPVNDLALVDVDDGAEAIAVHSAICQDRAVDLVLDDNYAPWPGYFKRAPAIS